ncbi:MAG: helix-turn-helix domain-containing protein [Oscillospiraceae bacterium]
MDKKMNKEIGRRIRQHRELLGYTREQFAEKMEISVRFAADIELGNRGMSIETLIKICEMFSVSADYLIFGKEKTENENYREINEKLSLIEEKNLPYAEELLRIFAKALIENKKQ